MPDNSSKTQPHDASRININEDYEVRYWTQKFSCTPQELTDAVNSVGTSAELVENYLNGARGTR